MPASRPTPVPGLHGAFIQQRLPAWFRHASAADLAHMRHHWLPPHWAEAAQLARFQAQSRRSAAALASTLKHLQGLAAFAEPRLKAQLRAELGFGLDVGNVEFVQIHYESVLLNMLLKARPRQQSLLQAALQNFAGDAQIHPGSGLAPKGAFGLELIADSAPAAPRFRYRYTQRLAVDPTRFARLCHRLDLGAQYQQHLSSVYEAPATRATVRARWIAACRDQLRVSVETAFIRQQISAAARQTLLALADGEQGNRFNGKPVCISQLKMFRKPLAEVLVISADRISSDQLEPVLVYLPGAPLYPLKEYPSVAAAQHDLRINLRLPAYQTLLRRYVAQADQAHVFSRLDDALYHLVKDSDGIYQREPDPHGQLYLREVPVTDELFGHLFERHLDKLKADARVLAVPSADADEQVREARLAFWEGTGLNVLNAVAFFLPAVAGVMAAVTAVQLVREVITGVEDWTHGDLQQAWDHLGAVGLNLALMAGLGLAGQPAPLMRDSELFDGLLRVRLPSGEERLWQPTLAPYAVALELQGLDADAQGLYPIGPRRYLRLEGAVYEVAADADGVWRLCHPHDAEAFQPPLRHNGEGLWQVTGEQPLRWSRQRLLRRLGPLTEGLDDEELAAAAQISGISEEVLRLTHVQRRPIPPLLQDTLRRLQANRAAGQGTGPRASLFASLYQAACPPGSVPVQRLQRMFPRLTSEAAREVLAHASRSEYSGLAEGLNGPSLRVAEEARRYQQQIRLSRALEGLYLPNLASPDSDRLAVALLERLPGWSGEVALALRETSLDGREVLRVGAPQVPVMVLVRSEAGYTLYDPQGSELSQALEMLDALFKALPAEERGAWRVPVVDVAGLRAALLAQAHADRGQAASALGLQPQRPWLRSPLRLADGRVGYPMGGGLSVLAPLRWRIYELFPQISMADLEELLRTFHGRDAQVEVSRLEEEYWLLEEDLERWCEQGDPFEQDTRRAAGVLIEAAWRRTGDNWRCLDLTGLEVGSFPPLDASFPHIRTLRLDYLQLAEGAGDFLAMFRQVRVLSLCEMALEQLPAALAQMRDLQELRLEANRLLVQPAMFEHLRPLQRLHTLRICSNSLTALPAQALAALGELRVLRTLDLHDNLLTFEPGQLQLLARLPLEELNLSHNRIRLDPASAEAFAQCPRLRQLNLSSNPLGRAPALGSLVLLEQLKLEHCALGEWPAGLSSLMQQEPLALRLVNLSGNEISHLPALGETRFGQLLIEAGPERPELYLGDNPLDLASLEQLQGIGQSIQQGGPLDAQLQAWLGTASGSERNLWNGIFADGAHRALKDMLERVLLSREFQRQATEVSQRIWKVLALAAEHTVLREELEEVAAGFPATCGDAGTDAFSELEVAVLCFERSQAALDQPARRSGLLALYRQLFRRAEVQRLADRLALRRSLRRQALLGNRTAPPLDPLDRIEDGALRLHEVDDIEIRLALRQHLARPLNYPEPSKGMLFSELAEVSRAVLRQVKEAVKAADTPANCRQWLVVQASWQRYLRQTFAAQFQVLSEFWSSGLDYLDYCLGLSAEVIEKLDASVLEVLARSLQETLLDGQGALRKVSLDNQRYLAAVEALRQAHEHSEAALILSLTRSEELAG